MSFEWNDLFTTNWELFGVITGFLSVALLIPVQYPRVQYLNWVASLLSAAVYVYIFYDYTLYGNAALQIYFIVYSLIGLWTWRGQILGREVTDEIPITFAPTRPLVLSIGAAIAAMVVVYPLLRHFGDASPFWDGLMICLSGAAIWLQVKKYVENWAVWIVVDLIAVPLHASNDLEATALLYGLYLCMCLIGIREWNLAANKNALEHAKI